jgi:uncharacterized protein DUF4328
MSTAGQEPWICGACRSVNEFKSQRCYKCRTPRELGEVDVAQLITAGAGATEATETAARAARTAALGGYRSSDARAGLTQCLLAATAVLAVLSSVAGADLIASALAGDSETVREDAPVVVAIGLAVFAAAGMTLVSWAAWLSRVVDNVPKIGLGWPNVSPGQAILENFLPGWNLLRVPAILRDVVTRLEPGGGRGNTLIAVAWLGLVGGVLLPYAARRLLAFVPMPLDARLDAAVIVAQLALGVTIAGIVFLIMLIRHIEAGMRVASRAADAQPRVSLADARAR